MTEQDAVDTEILEQATAQSGAVVMGRRLFDIVDGPGGWNEDMGYGADQTGTPPFFVVTHAPPQDVRLERELGMRFTFVDDLATAIDQARAAATHGDVVIMGGGDVIGQALEQGLVDELRIHLAPMLLGGGTPLFKPGTRQMYRQRDDSPVEERGPPRLRARVNEGRGWLRLGSPPGGLGASAIVCRNSALADQCMVATASSGERPAMSRSQTYDSMPIVARTASTKRRNSSVGTCPRSGLSASSSQRIARPWRRTNADRSSASPRVTAAASCVAAVRSRRRSW